MTTHDPHRIALEIREQLASAKRRLGFFFGAGTSMAVGLPGIQSLTTEVSHRLEKPYKAQYQEIKGELKNDANVENVLDRIRIYRELMLHNDEREYGGLRGSTAAGALDGEVCRMICDIVRDSQPDELGPYLTFAHWLRALHANRDWPVEIYTTNYDLLSEQALEKASVPYFDGFVGSAAPFFVAESVEADRSPADESVYPPRGWTRLWKLHGSINWHVHHEKGSERITRLSGSEPKPGDQLMVFPSREKYAQSRKLPFIAFHDRFRRFLAVGECLLVVVGYSFSDEHVNEIIFQGLKSNPRASVTVLAYGEQLDSEEPGRRALPETFITYAKDNRNLTVCGPDRACIGGLLGAWNRPSCEPSPGEECRFWDESAGVFTLGDFNAFGQFLDTFMRFGS